LERVHGANYPAAPFWDSDEKAPRNPKIAGRFKNPVETGLGQA